MSRLISPGVLRAVLWFDAVTGVLLATLHLAMTETLAQWLGLPVPLVSGSGALLIAYVFLIVVIASQRQIPQNLLWALVWANVAWAAACFLLLMSSAIQPSLWGKAYLLMLASSVGTLAALQWLGVRRLPRAATV